VYTPTQLASLARRVGLAGFALTDHDTVGGIVEAEAAAGSELELIAGVEITARSEAREVHILGLFVDARHPLLISALDELARMRRIRFDEMVGNLRKSGIELDEPVPNLPSHRVSLTRRHLAEALVRAGKAGSIRDAFGRYLHDGSRYVAPKVQIHAERAIECIHSAGGVAALAHPPGDFHQGDLSELRGQGLDAIEVRFPNCQRSRSLEIRGWADQLGLAVTGGSDCHGPAPWTRALGALGATRSEVDVLRAKSRGM
jgi:hypothetical protein